MVKELSRYLNFSYELTFNNQVWANRDENGSYLGIAGRLQRGTADFGFSEISVTYERFQTFDYSQVYSYEIITFTTSKLKQKAESVATALIRPFSGPVWAACLAVLIMCALGIKLAIKSSDSFGNIIFNILAYSFGQRK